MKRAWLFCLLAWLVLLFAGEAGADRGIGGTYVPPPATPAPRPVPGGTTKPIGTTIIGTIVKFGSVHVNDVVVDVSDMSGLALGQTVRVYAPAAIAERMTAGRVDVVPALTGPVDKPYAKGELTVLGQKILIDRSSFVEDGVKLADVTAGTMLIVHGLEQADGALRATRIERAPAGMRAALRGRLTPAADGSLAVHGVRVAARVAPDWIGRVVVAAVDMPTRSATEVQLWEPLAETVAADLSIEGIVGNDVRPDAVTIEGATFKLDGSTIVRNATLLRPGQRVVLEGTRAADGSWRAARIEAPPRERTEPALPTLPPDLPFTPPPAAPPVPAGPGNSSLLPGKR
ncbi:DUF5666 domain-containing protein [Roseiterribacter gracilis]|uniref:DUF5666 domain-containing protein n=1 Tax=Roseiterribacter gracilis TaxID=2812848 RepID=A0A8S8X9L7_9PROT|nr:hypothetical protein TMPK1_02620 [Rhodospirillales bacterium TMPK1]